VRPQGGTGGEGNRRPKEGKDSRSSVRSPPAAEKKREERQNEKRREGGELAGDSREGKKRLLLHNKKTLAYDRLIVYIEKTKSDAGEKIGKKF